MGCAFDSALAAAVWFRRKLLHPFTLAIRATVPETNGALKDVPIPLHKC